jgi:hypothetical protein
MPENRSDAELMRSLLAEMSQPSEARDDPQLVRLADQYRRGIETDIAPIKRASVQYIKDMLPDSIVNERRAFFVFLVQSELINESVEIRTALYAAIEPRLNNVSDPLVEEVASLLLRSARPPAERLAARLLERIRTSYLKRPNWKQAGILASLVGKSSTYQYTTNTLLSDITRLADDPDFEKAVKLRNALWSGVGLDSIEIVTHARRTQREHAANYPDTPDFAGPVQRVRKSIRAL